VEHAEPGLQGAGRCRKSKKEAIDLMMENANLIARPILMRDRKWTFGFDRRNTTILT